RKDGYKMSVEIAAKEFIYKGRDARVLTIWDVTLKKQMETHLLQTQKMESLGQLAAGIAHDFNNILASIGGHARLCELDLLKGTYSPEQLSKRLKTILSASERAKVLIQQLLGFSRKGKYNPQDLDLNALVKEVSNLLDKGLSSVVPYQIKKDLLCTYNIYADGNQIHQVIQNLIVNARDAMPEGGTIEIRTEDCQTKEFMGSIEKIPLGDYVKLSVCDQGYGIEKNLFSKIFEPFFTTKEDGTGLGLSTVWGILKNHQSYIHIISDKNNGTCFELYFPSVITDKGIKVQQHVIIKQRKRKILVVDDDPDIRYIVEEYLIGNGYDVVLASGALEAIAEYEKGDIDLVLTDLVMSPIDGSQLFNMIRKINKSALVYIMSGYYDDDRVQLMLNSGALGFIAKPFDLDYLGQTINGIVSAS
ncbi:MAG: response regulator, partial [Chlamydiota bacterium]|nr:response regulator [Chlamydiota bacterium]